MIITNLKVFNKVCTEMQKYCKQEKGESERLFHNVFFMDKNKMCVTNGHFMVVRNMSDCVINDETFAFPCNVKPVKTVTSDGEKLIIENKKEKFFDKNKKEITFFNWKKGIPTDKPIVTKEYDFSDYEPTKISLEKESTVTFCENNDVIFDYKDYNETQAIYSDVVKTYDMFDNINTNKITTTKFPMNQIYYILKHSKNFIYEEYPISYRAVPRIFKIKDYDFIIMPILGE